MRSGTYEVAMRASARSAARDRKSIAGLSREFDLKIVVVVSRGESRREFSARRRADSAVSLADLDAIDRSASRLTTIARDDELA